ncbi:MAG: hypothetical protein R3E90_04100 [Marinicella sp.]
MGSFWHKIMVLLLVLISLHIVGLSVAQNWQDQFTFNGFYTIDLTMTDEDIDVISSGGPRFFEDKKPSINNSLIGVQVRYDFNEKLAATIQGTAFLDRNDSLDFDLNWGYLSYQFDNDWQGRVGKFQIPFLQGTELRNVGFTRLWARPLTPGSGAAGYDFYQGLEVLKKVSYDESSWEFQWGFGKAEHNLEDQIDNQDMALFTTRYLRDDFWLRGALLHANYQVISPRGTLIENAGNILMGSLESEWRPNDWVINLGYSQSKGDTVPDDTMTYLSVGRVFGDFTPYILGSYRNQNFPRVRQINAPPGPPPGGPGSGPPAPPQGDLDLYSQALGVRWHINPKTALKLQFEHLKRDDQSRAAVGRQLNEGNVISIIMEGVF